MELIELLDSLHLPAELAARLEPEWARSVGSLPETIPELTAAGWSAWREYCGFDAGIEGDLAAGAAAIANDPRLKLLFWHYLQSLYEYPRGAGLNQWPTLEAQLEGRGGLFYLLAALAVVPRLQAAHRARGVDAAITRATATQVRLFCDEMYRRGNGGKPGVFVNQCYWFRNYSDGLLYRLGRMEFMCRPANGYIEVWRHRGSGQTLALAAAGLWVGADGHLIRAEAAAALSPPPRRTERVDTETTVRGAAISPLGFVEAGERTLALAEWERVFGPGDPILEMHIPAGGGMPPEACIESMRQGFDFFARQFPETPLRATTCISWICNTQLFELLPAKSNLIQFLRELYLFPVESHPNAGLFFVFFQPGAIDLNSAPESTSVQRAVKQFLLAGNPWRSGGMFFLKDDLERFGTQHYRRTAAVPEV